MEVFLQSPPQNQTNPKSNSNPQINKSVVETPDKQTKAKDNSLEIEEKIQQIEEQLRKSKTLDITTFNQLVYSKHLKFKLLLIRSRIYVVVTDGQKTANVAIEVPRWGGTSLRYMISSCVLDWCQVIEKSTSKGKILSYQPVSVSDDDTDDVDIFD